MSRTGLAIGGIGLAAVLGYSWHRSIVRAAEQRQESETRSAVVTELNAQHAIEKQKYEDRVADLEIRFNELAKTRAAAVQRIEVITEEATQQREQIPTLSGDAVRAAIRQRLAGTSPAASP